MKPFDFSARYYDLLYRSKDYKGEAEYVSNLIRDHSPNALSLLDLGCGTGKHAALLKMAGFDVVGVDISDAMLDHCRLEYPEIQVCQGDVRTVRLGRKFDAVVSLFHVASYQTENNDLHWFCQTIEAHLNPGGVAVFDCWFGPGVLTDRPAVRVRRLEDETVNILRVAEPEISAAENVVTVKYDIRAYDKIGDRHSMFQEEHRMRYFFVPELEAALSLHGLQMTMVEEWMTKKPPSFDCWNLVVVATKK